MIVEQLLGGLLDLVGASGVPVATVSVLLVAALYARKGLRFGGFLASGIRTGTVVMGVLAVLLATGVIPMINVDALLGLLGTVLDGVTWAWGELR